MKPALFALLLMMVCISPAPGQGDDEDMPPPGSGRHRGVFGKLDLTGDQQKQFDKLASNLRKQQIALRSNIETHQVDLRDLMREDAPDRAKIEAAATEINRLQGEMNLNRLGFWFDVNKVLTADQKKAWKGRLRPHFGPGEMDGRMRKGMHGAPRRLPQRDFQEHMEDR